MLKGATHEEILGSNGLVPTVRHGSLKAKQILAERNDQKYRVVCTIEARMGSTRLPGKVLMLAQNTPMLGHLIRRLRLVSNLADIVVATTVNREDDQIVDFCLANGVGYFRGSEEDVLGRVAGAAESFGATGVLAVTADCPIIDPSVVQRVVDEFIQNDYDLVSNGMARTYPDGMDANVVSIDALKVAVREATNPFDREHVLRFIYRRPERFSLLNLEAPDHLHWPELGLTLDEEGDYALLVAIIDALYPSNPAFDCEQVVSFLRENLHLVELNSSVLRRGDS